MDTQSHIGECIFRQIDPEGDFRVEAGECNN
jgi:hypothetical protein